MLKQKPTRENLWQLASLIGSKSLWIQDSLKIWANARQVGNTKQFIIMPTTGPLLTDTELSQFNQLISVT